MGPEDLAGTGFTQYLIHARKSRGRTHGGKDFPALEIRSGCRYAKSNYMTRAMVLRYL
jgi:hypothetical protein